MLPHHPSRPLLRAVAAATALTLAGIGTGSAIAGPATAAPLSPAPTNSASPRTSAEPHTSATPRETSTPQATATPKESSTPKASSTRRASGWLADDGSTHDDATAQDHDRLRARSAKARSRDTTVVDEDFSSGSLPTGWHAAGGDWRVRDGRLVGTGAAKGNPPARITFGKHLRDFRLDFTARIDSASDGNRWIAAGLDVPADGAGPWQQAALRTATAGDSGIEFAQRTAAGSWNVTDHSGAEHDLGTGTDARISLEVHGTQGTWSLDGTKVLETTKLARTTDGGMGLLVDGVTAEFDDLTVTKLAALPVLDTRKPGQAPAVMADNGNSSVAPAGTPAAFRAAAFAGAQLERATVRRTSDGVPVVRTDENLATTTADGTGTVAHTTAEQLARLDAGSWFSKDLDQQRVLTLQKFANAYGDLGRGSLVELPGQSWNNRAARKDLGRALAAADPQTTLFASDSPAVLREIARQRPDAHLVLQAGATATPRSAPDWLKLDAVELSAAAVRRAPDLAKHLGESGMKVVVDGADEPADWRAATRLGAEAVVTSRPDRALGWAAANQDPGSTATTPLIAGHRGDSSVLPENSLASHEGAWRDGADYAEDDINLTTDGEYVVMHDATLDRTTRGSGNIWDLPWSKIKDLEVGSWKAPEFDGLFVPRLSDVLDAAKRTDAGPTVQGTTGKRAKPRRVLLEFKDDWTKEQASGVIKQLRTSGIADRVLLQGFSVTTMKNLAAVAPEFKRGLLVNTLSASDDPVAMAREAKVGWVNPGAGALKAQPKFAGRLHAAGLKTAVWTLDTPDDWNAAIKADADMIITNRSDYLAGWLAGREE